MVFQRPTTGSAAAAVIEARARSGRARPASRVLRMFSSRMQMACRMRRAWPLMPASAPVRLTGCGRCVAPPGGSQAARILVPWRAQPISSRSPAPPGAGPAWRDLHMTAASPLQDILATLEDPAGGGPLGAAVRWDARPGGRGAQVQGTTGFPFSAAWAAQLQARAEAALAAAGQALETFELRPRIAAHAVQGGLAPHPRIRNVVAVGSGKGGVGKSTTAVNLALALQRLGARVGVLDADVYGPSVPAMLGLSGRPESPDGKSIEPMRAFGIEAMSIGLLVEQDTPMIWRGPMATSALMQL